MPSSGEYRILCKAGCNVALPSADMAVFDPPEMVALADFNASPYGSEYIDLSTGDRIALSTTVADDRGWSYGLHWSSNTAGWFPSEYVRRGQADRTKCFLFVSPRRV